MVTGAISRPRCYRTMSQAVGDSRAPTAVGKTVKGTAPLTPSLASLIEPESRRRSVGILLGWLVELPLIGPLVARAARAPNRMSFVRTRFTPFHARLLRRGRDGSAAHGCLPPGSPSWH